MLIDFEPLTYSQLELLNNVELMEYKRNLMDHGQKVESHVELLKESWHIVIGMLQARLADLEWEVAFIQADKDNGGEEDLGGNYSPEMFIN